MTEDGVLGLVPARGGSKGVSGKNLRPLCGRPLLQYVASAAVASAKIDRLVLSTDSPEIAALGRELGLEVPFMRPAALAADETPMIDVIRHALRELEDRSWRPEVVVLLQPTSPLRQPRHIVAALELLRRTGSDSVVTVVELPRHYSPDYVMKISDDRLMPFLPEGARTGRRQDARPAYVRDGTVYAFRRAAFVTKGTIYGSDCRPLVLPAEESLTIDTPDDWAAAERRLRFESSSP